MNHKRCHPYLLLCWILISTAYAQDYGNEWIQYEQSYWKVKIAQTGWYRIGASELQAAGLPSIDPRALQVFWRGQELAIRVVGEEDGVLDPQDYLEFFAQHNDGSSDQALYYPNPGNHLNPYYNLHSDTTTYFITYRTDGGSGKRIAVQTATSNNQPALDYVWQELLQLPAEQCAAGRNYVISGSYLFISSYDAGEGWVSLPIQPGGNRVLNFAVQQAAINTLERPVLEVRIVSRSYFSSTFAIDIGTGSNFRQLTTGSIANYGHTTLTQTLEWTDMPTTGTGSVSLRIRNISTNGTRVSIVYAKLRYPRALNMQNNPLIFDVSPQNTPYTLSFSQLPANSRLFDLTDPYNLIEIPIQNNSAWVDAHSTPRRFFLQSQTFTNLPISPVSFVPFNPASYNYLIVAHPKLMTAASGYTNVVEAYASYRASPAGGNYQTLIMNIFNLYDQFNYGETSPLAIRRFAKYCYDQGNPAFLLIIGQGITLPMVDAQFGNVSTNLNIRSNPLHFAQNLVPTWGFPGTDLPFTAGFDNVYTYAPGIATGRLSVSNAQQLANYLNKVKEHESTECAHWRKRIVHLSGGANRSEQETFRAFVDYYKSLAEGNYLRASVRTLSKRTTEDVEFINIADEVNEGVSLVTFFGHSSAILTDIDIGFVSIDGNGYRNKGKYPLILANGCSLGDVYSARNNMANDWLYTADRGAIAWKANTSLAGAAWLHNYSTRWYAIAFTQTDFFSAPLGEIDQLIVRTYGTGLSPGIELAHVEQMTLQGDPALRIIGPNLPDLCTQNAWLSLNSFDLSPPSAQSDSLQLRLIVASAGKHSEQEFAVSVLRTFPDGSTQLYYPVEKYGPIERLDTLHITIYRPDGIAANGLNRFEVKIDALDEIDESNENNNTALLEYNLPGIAVNARFPSEYSIVSQQPVVLMAQSSNTFLQAQDVIFELDTTAYFNSPVKRTAIRPLNNGMASWEVELLTDLFPSDSLVYFWRVNLANATQNPNALWSESSFIYLKNSPEGWAQRHFYQFRKSIDNQIQKNFAQRRWAFAQINNTIRVQTYGGSHPDVNNTSLFLNNFGIVFNYQHATCANGRLVVMAIDRESKQPYVLSNHGLCGRTPGFVSSFSSSDIQNGLLQAYISTLPDGDYLVVFNKGQITQSAWQAASSALIQVGASPAQLATLQTGHPYILIGQKGGAALAEVISSSVSNAAGDAIQASVQLGGGFSSGSITSTLIGPASGWEAVFYNYRSLENPSTDQNRLDIIGVRLNGQEELLMSNVPSGQPINQIDAGAYPYLRLRFSTSDETNQTPGQLRQWIVRYAGVAEGFLNIEAAGGSAVYQIADKLEGEPLRLPFVFENISNRAFDADSLDVEYELINNTLGRNQTYLMRIKAPAPQEKSQFYIDIPTQGWAGQNRFKIFVNPRRVPEQYYDNNRMELEFRVIEDRKNPNLEVTFDGVRIMNGDIVSPNVLIRVDLHDDNPFLLHQDTTGIQMELRRPCQGCPFERIYFSDPRVRWQSQPKHFIFEYQAQNLSDGRYTLRVQGSDARGNAAGTQAYEVEFEVVSETAVTHFYPYPNPFSSSCRFVFTLTGTEVPQEVKIQIMTISGRIVREITQQEIGPIRIGHNITQYAWDGTDEYGDRLANGVYLYRVLMRLNGQQVPIRSTPGDRAFKEGFGKLYILR